MQAITMSRVRQNVLALLLGTGASCLGLSAQAVDFSASHGDASFQNLSLKMTTTLAGIFDAEDCDDDLQTELLPSLRLSNLSSASSANMTRLKATPTTDPVIVVTAPKLAAAPQATQVSLPLVAQASPAPSTTWEIALNDKTLNATLSRWTTMAGWQLLWEMPVDYAVEARTTVPGTFEEAVETVAKSMETAEIPMKAIFYKGNKVLRIVAKGGK